MPEKKNALAELAKRITDVLAFAQDELYLEHKQTLDKCERIIAELAKVRDKLGNPYLDDIENAYKKCCAIAEEVVKE